MKSDLTKEHSDLSAQIESVTVTDEQIRNIQELAEAIRPGLEHADFAARQRLIDFLDVTARLAVEDGERVAYTQCIIPGAGARLSVDSVTTTTS